MTDKPEKLDNETEEIFGRLESDFASVLDELMGDESLDKFRKEYRKVLVEHGNWKMFLKNALES